MSESPKRPGTVLFAAIVLFVVGTVYLLNASLTGVAAGWVVMNPDAADPNAKIQPGDVIATVRFFNQEIPGYVATVAGLAVTDMVFGIAQIVLGVGLLRLRPAARIGVFILMLVKLLYVFGCQAYTVMMVMPAQVRFAELNPPEVPGGGPQPIPIVLITQITVATGVCINVFMQVAVTVLIISVLNSQGAKAAFAKIPKPPSEEPPREEPPKAPSLYSGYDEE